MFSDGSEWRSAPGDPPACDACGEQPASVHVLRVSTEGLAQAHLCAECAEGGSSQVDGPALVLAIPVPAFSETRASDADPPLADVPDRLVASCAVCGTTLRDFRESGLFGCAACHELFRPHVGEVEGGGTDDLTYEGKVPSRLPGDEAHRREVVRLRRMLRELVDSERFEEAAGVRDRLMAIEGGGVGRSVDG